jgi:GGDEF domain-containing protein
MIIRILLAESNPAESNLEHTLFLKDVLTELDGREYWSDWVHLETLHPSNWEEAERILKESRTGPEPVDVLLLDLNLNDPAPEAIRASLHAPLRAPARRVALGTEIFHRAKAAAPQVPVVLLVDPQDITLAEFLLREGAQDFLLKSQVDCAPLAHALRNAIERHRYLESARAAAMTDPLTGLLNRAAFLALVERDRRLALRAHRRILLAVGEAGGGELACGETAARAPGQSSGDQRNDLALVKTAEKLRAIAGPADLVARIGERRFAFALYEDAVCETKHRTWGAAWDRLEAAAAGMHLTLGAAEFDPARPVSLEDLLQQAERELAPIAVAARR